MTSSVDAVIFDWGGTLTPWQALPPVDAWRAYAAAVHADDPERAEALATGLVAAEDARWATVRDRHDAFTVAHVLADAAASAASVDPDASDPGGAALDAYREFWAQVSHVRPEARPTLERLREQGLRLGVLSSTSWPADWHDEWLRRDGVHDLFDGRVWSSDLPVTKPHPDAFRAAMDAVGVADPARCVYVGDRPYDDISGAKGAGMRAVFVPHSDIPAVQQVPVDAEPDAVIQRLSDLPELLAGW